MIKVIGKTKNKKDLLEEFAKIEHLKPYLETGFLFIKNGNIYLKNGTKFIESTIKNINILNEWSKEMN